MARAFARNAFAAVAVGLCLAGGNAGASSTPPPGSPEPAPGHSGFGLCGTRNILPVAQFHSEYTDPLGNHYHGWIPPAGAPYFVECLLGDSLALGQP
jgi:hypothetical protein